MDETIQTPQSTPDVAHQGDEVKQAAMADRAAAIAGVAQINQNLGYKPAEHPLFDDRGVLMTRGDITHEQQHRQAHGAPSEDTHVALPQSQ